MDAVVGFREYSLVEVLAAVEQCEFLLSANPFQIAAL